MVRGAGGGFLSVSQLAAREGVSRARVLQWLAAGRVEGARRIGHHWAIPAGASVVRRKPGRPRRLPRARRVPTRLLGEMARKYLWWHKPGESAEPDRVITQVMELGDYEDILRLESAFGRERLARALQSAAPGRLSPRSWAYWHYRLGLAAPGKAPPSPPRRRPA
jgi:hypothetical protein